MKKKNSSNSSKGKSGNTKQISPSKHWFLTLNNYTTQSIDFFCADSSIERYVFQEEMSESGTPHLQGHFEFKKKVRPVGHFTGTPCSGGHWEKTKSRRAAITYCSKCDTRNGQTYTKGFPKNAFRQIKVLTKDQLYFWQKDVLFIAESEPDDRTINWIWEAEGNRGKSAMVKYLVVNHHAMIISGKSADIKYQIATAELPPDIIIYDVPRAKRNRVNYAALEQIKDGLFASTKYESKMVLIPDVHIFVFANFEPILDDTVSKDRWNIIEI